MSSPKRDQQHAGDGQLAVEGADGSSSAADSPGPELARGRTTAGTPGEVGGWSRPFESGAGTSRGALSTGSPDLAGVGGGALGPRTIAAQIACTT